MNMLAAIALSPGNKASAYNDQGKTVVVLQRFEQHDYWWHCWLLIDKKNVSQITATNFSTIKEAYHVDPEGQYWSIV